MEILNRHSCVVKQGDFRFYLGSLIIIIKIDPVVLLIVNDVKIGKWLGSLNSFSFSVEIT